MENVPHYIRKESAGTVAMGAGEFISSYCNRIRTQLDYLASKSEVSLKWYTHTNPNGCWICDTFNAAYTLLGILRELGEQLERETPSDTDGGPSETGDGGAQEVVGKSVLLDEQAPNEPVEEEGLIDQVYNKDS